MKIAFGLITVLLYVLQRVNSQACPDGSNVAKMCVSGTYTGQTVLLDTASYNSSVTDCTCTFETTSSILKLITYVAPNYQGCNSALRLYSSSGNNIRFQCLMSGTYLDTSAHKYGVATFETYGEAYDTNYCLLLEIAGSIADTITVKCTGNPEIGSDVISTVKSPEATSTIELAMDITTTETTLAFVSANTNTTTESSNTTETTSADITNNTTESSNTTETTSADVTNNTTESSNTTETTSADITNNITESSNTTETTSADVTNNTTDSSNTTETTSADITNNTTDITNNTTKSSIVYTQDYTVSSTSNANIFNTYLTNITQSEIDENATETTLADVNTNNTTTESIIKNTQYYTVASTKDLDILNGNPLNETVSIVNENTTESTSPDVYKNHTTESNIVNTQDFTTSSARDASISNASPINVTVLVVDENYTEATSADVITNNTTESSIVNTVSTTRDANILNANPVYISVSIVEENTTQTTSADVYTNNYTTQSSIIYPQDFTTTSASARDANNSNANPINETVSVIDINTAVNETESQAIVTSEAEAQSTRQITYTVGVSGSPAIGLASVNIESKPATESIIETTTESNPATDTINVMSTEEVSAESLSNTSTESAPITTGTYKATSIANIQSKSSTNTLVDLAEDMITTSPNIETSYQTTAAPLVEPSLIPELKNIDTNYSVDSNVIPTEGISQNYSSTDTIVSELPNHVPDAIDFNTSNSLNNVSANLDYAEATDNNQTQINNVTTEDATENIDFGIVTGTILFNGGGSDKPKTIQMIGAVTSDRLMDMEEPSSNLTPEALVLDNTHVSTGSMKFTSNVNDTSNLGNHFTTQVTTGAQADNAVSTTSTTPPLEKTSVEGPIQTTENDVKDHGLQFPATHESIISANTTSNEMATHNISTIIESFNVYNTSMNNSEFNASNDIVDSDLNITVNDTYNAHSPALPVPEFKEPVLDFDISNSFANKAYSPRTMNTLTFTTSEARYVTENSEPVAFVPRITERVVQTSTEVPTSQPNVAIDEYANNITSSITIVNVTEKQSGFTTDANNIVFSTVVEAINISNVTDPTYVNNETTASNSLDVSTDTTSLETEPIQTDISAASTVQQTSVRSVRSNDGLNTVVTTTASIVSETTIQRIEATSQQVLNVESVAMMNTSSPDASRQLNNSDPYSLQENNSLTLIKSKVTPSQTEDMFKSISSDQEMATNSTPNQETTIKVTEFNQILTTPSEWMSFGLDQHNHLDIYSLETKVTTPSSAEPFGPLESNMSEFTSNQDVFMRSMSNQETMVPKIEEQASTTPSVSYTSDIAQNNSIVSTVSTVTDRTTAFVTEDTRSAERATKVNLRALFASAGGVGLPSPTDASILSEDTTNALVNSNLLLATTTESNENISYSTVASTSTERSGVYGSSTILAGSSSTASFGISSTVASETSSNALDGTNSSVSAETSSTVLAGTGTFSSGDILPVDLSSETVQPMKESVPTTIKLTTSTSWTGMEITSNKIVNLDEKYTSTSMPLIEGDMIVKETAMINNAEQVINVPKEVVINPDAIDQNALDDFLANLEKQIIQESTTKRTEIQTSMNQADLKSSTPLNENAEIIIEKTTLTSSDVYKSTDTLHKEFISSDTSGDLINVPTTPVQFFSVVDDTVVVADKADPRQVETRRKTSDSNDTNVTFDTGKIGALDIDMNNDTYIMVVGGIVGLVVLAVVIGILCHRGRKRRSEKGNISANGVDPGTHQNQAFDNSSADPEQGTNTVDIKNEASSGPTEQNGDTTIPPAEEQNGNIDL